MSKILVYVKNPGEEFRVESVADELETMRAIVGGHLEVTRLPKNIWMWTNEEGKIEDLPINLALFCDTDFESNKILDVIHGPCFFTSRNGDETASLSVEQIEWLKAHSKMMETKHDGLNIYQIHWDATPVGFSHNFYS